MLKFKKGAWIYGTVGAMLFLVLVSTLAYLKLIPTEIKSIPYYDSVGHFVLFGIFGFFAEMAFGGKRRELFNLAVPLGATLVVVYATIDEILQAFSQSRTFDLHDLGFGILGIYAGYLLGKKLLAQDKNA